MWSFTPSFPITAVLLQQGVVSSPAVLLLLGQGHDVEVAVCQLLVQGEVPGGLPGVWDQEPLGELRLAQGFPAPVPPGAVDEGQGEGVAVVLLLLVPGETPAQQGHSPSVPLVGNLYSRKALQELALDPRGSIYSIHHKHYFPDRELSHFCAKGCKI